MVLWAVVLWDVVLWFCGLWFWPTAVLWQPSSHRAAVHPGVVLVLRVYLCSFCSYLLPAPFFLPFLCSPYVQPCTDGRTPQCSISPLKSSCVLLCRLNYCTPLGRGGPMGREEEAALNMGFSLG